MQLKQSNEKRNNVNGIIVFVAIAMIAIIITAVIITVNGQKGKHTKATSTQTEDNQWVSNEVDKTIQGVIKAIDTDKGSVTIYSITNNKEIRVSYYGGTTIKNKYDSSISMKQVGLGEIVDVTYSVSTSELKSLHISDKAWEYKNVNNFTIMTSTNTLKIGEDKYQLDQNLSIISNDKFINLININDKDQLTIKGLENKVYSIIVTKGHGYIQVINFSDFVGGTIEVGYSVILPVSENMLIAVREGEYTVTMTNGELVGSKHVSVSRDQTVTVDMSEFKQETERVGQVEFDINPEGADLYVNGTLTDYSQAIELNYGEHEIQVVLSGYETYTGTLTISNPTQKVSVDLANENVTVDSDDTENTDSDGDSSNEQSTITESESDDTESSSESTEKVIDSAHTISVNSPTGAEVYFNDTYKGIAPISFTKEIGTHNITISMSGYETKSYTVEVVDDSKDTTYSFPDLEKSK